MDIPYLNEIKIGIDLFRSAIGLAREAKELLLDGPSKEGVEAAFVKAENQLEIAEASMAKTLGYELCQCRWPPQIMLLKSVHRRNIKIFVCSTCNRQEPPQSHFDDHDRTDAIIREHNSRGPGGWMAD